MRKFKFDDSTVAALREVLGNTAKIGDIKEFEVNQLNGGDTSINPSLHRYIRKNYKLLKHGVYSLVDKFNSDEYVAAAPVAAAPVAAPAVLEISAPKVVQMPVEPKKAENISQIAEIRATALYYPEVSKNFVPFGVYSELSAVLSSNIYAPVMITGDSGNGKTFSVMQAAAKAKRAVVTCSIDYNTDDSDLIGKFGLVNGNTVYEKGPVRIAMETGSILLLDELDRGNPENLICLNALLDGYPVLDKKTGETITAKEGFQIVATANTKGQGDDSDRFVAAKVLDTAFLERFAVILEQGYPTAAVESKILGKVCEDEQFVECLVKWAQATRETYQSGGIEDFITTRRLVMIADKNYRIFGDRKKAVKAAIGRFNAMTRDAFMELYSAIDAASTASAQTVSSQVSEVSSTEETFEF